MSSPLRDQAFGVQLAPEGERRARDAEQGSGGYADQESALRRSSEATLPTEEQTGRLQRVLNGALMHLNRAFDLAESELRAEFAEVAAAKNLSGKTLLTDAVGDAGLERELNALEHVNVITIEDLLPLFTADGMNLPPGSRNFGATSLAAVQHAILRRLFTPGRRLPRTNDED